MEHEKVLILEYVPDPSMSTLTSEEMEEVDDKINILLERAEMDLKEAEEITPRSVSEPTSMMDEEGDESECQE